jgi:pyruvyltransferase
MARCYFWQENGNFGDLLSPILLQHFCQASVTYSEPDDADLVVAGSVLDVVPDGWSGIVAGAGQLLAETQRDLTNATVLGLRGHLTARAAGMHHDHGVVIGDPGLLAAELAPATAGKYDLGIVPHWSDDTLYARFRYLNPVLIEPWGDPIDIISMIGSCKKIVSSSLHGIIVADSFGIPRRAERFPAMATNPHEGGDFKWQDYGSAIGQPVEFGKQGGQIAPLGKIEKIKWDLFEMFRNLAHALA